MKSYDETDHYFSTVYLFFAEAYAQYKIWIKAYTVKNEGKSSEPLVQMTDVRAPGQPIVVNLTCQNGNTLFLKVRKSQKIFLENLRRANLVTVLGGKNLNFCPT